jgi:hypothetical protein
MKLTGNKRSRCIQAEQGKQNTARWRTMTNQHYRYRVHPERRLKEGREYGGVFEMQQLSRIRRLPFQTSLSRIARRAHHGMQLAAGSLLRQYQKVNINLGWPELWFFVIKYIGVSHSLKSRFRVEGLTSVPEVRARSTTTRRTAPLLFF